MGREIMSFNKLGTYCKDCTERYPACHDTCEKYNTLKKKHLEEKAIIDKERYNYLNYLKFKQERVTDTKKRTEKARIKRS